MRNFLASLNDEQKLQKAAARNFNESLDFMNARHDKMFALVFVFQYFLGITIALLNSPFTWEGGKSSVNIHLYTAAFLGGVVALGPILLILQKPGREMNQWAITFSQSMFSILLIHLTGGRIETHFHIFVSLAFLSYYRNYKIIIFATIITLVDHLVRGWFWPQSVYGVEFSGYARAFEHAAWVLFEDTVLLVSIHSARAILWTNSLISAQLNFNYENIESVVKARTDALMEANKTIIEQKETLHQSAKFSALGEMAGGVAHEINNPLTVIMGISAIAQDKLTKGKLTDIDIKNSFQKIDKTVDRINKTIKGLRSFSRNAVADEMEISSLSAILKETMDLCEARLQNGGITFSVICPESLEIRCRPTQISQIIMNLISNSIDALEKTPDKWLRINVDSDDKKVFVRVLDSGAGIPDELKEKLMKLFFTTKEVGKGTGLGLSISKNLAETHGGALRYDETSTNTCFVLELPLAHAPVVAKTA